MKSYVPLLWALLIGSVSTSFSQDSQSTVDVNTDIDVVAVYEQYVKEGYGDLKVYKRLANGFYFKNEYLKAKQYFETWFDIEPPTETAAHRYRQTLKALQLPLKNNKYLLAFQEKD
tara:strand:+ start:27884 stop:28231 length:348 start_codon:yes stop_codon:yes gene_type:complete